MKRSLSVLLLAGASLFAMAAHAAPVFMLQFGSFETREEADEKLGALKSKHAGVLSRMELGVREVTLPPDNLTVYRTQAGPLATRADAQSVCSQLASNGDECYVVETAMMQPATPATQQVARAPEPAAAPAAPAPGATPAPAPEKVAAPAPAPVKTEMPASAATAAAVPAKSAPATPAPAATPVPPVTPRSISARDPQNIAAMNRVAAPVTLAADPQAEAMQRELAAASAEPVPAPRLASKPVKDRSLWSRIFGDDEEAQAAADQPARTATAEDAVQAAPVETIAVANAEPQPMPAPPEPLPAATPMPAAAASVPVSEPVVTTPPNASAPNAPTPPGATTDRTVMIPNAVVDPARTPASAALAPMPPAAPAPVMAPPPAPVAVQPQPQPVAVTPVVTEAAPFPLPPPPAPLSGMSRPAPVTVTPAVAAPMPVTSQPNMPAPVMAAPQPIGTVPDANVRVEEAKRVPLTQMTAPVATPAPTPSFPPPAPMPSSAPAAMPPAMSPSATIGQKTLWAQVGPFADQQAALAFWDQYRRTHPDFPVVRVRVTSPLMAQQRGIAQVNLRVGPFGREGFITSLCNGMVKEGLQCGVITDMGIASGAGSQRGLLPGSRYGR